MRSSMGTRLVLTFTSTLDDRPRVESVRRGVVRADDGDDGTRGGTRGVGRGARGGIGDEDADEKSRAEEVPGIVVASRREATDARGGGLLGVDAERR